ncbi:MAG: recombinase family protein [Desulfobulbaceae bacterium]|jgi:DNA invertase Pin-like site-specific DNA recombinase|nr:recombinase family protein [Desulfobulbaceae bacterium]
MEGRYVIYFRVSTDKQGKSGLGLEAQRATVMNYLNGGAHEIVATYTEIESGGKNDRAELQKAIRDCRLKGAKLIVAKLDRLSRDLEFIAALQKSAVKFVIAEMPDATELTIHIYAAMAQHERKLISQRTKDALAVAKANGQIKGQGFFGNPCLRNGERVPGSGGPVAAAKATAAKIVKADAFAMEIAQVVKDLVVGGESLREIADGLNNAGYRTAKGGEWHATSVKRILDRTREVKP